MAWPLVALGDVCVARTGTEDPRSRASGQFTYIDISSVDASKKAIIGARVLSADEAPSRARRKICEHDVLVSMTRPNLNAVAKVDASLAGEICSTGFSVLRAGPRLNPAYLFHFVQTPRFVDSLSGLTAGALYPAVTEAQVRQQLIPLPPLAEQQRIVEILDRAAAIQRLRRAAEEKAREIIPALFVDMFGDPATNPKGWPVGTLAAVVDEFRYGTSMKSGATGVPVLRIPNVIGGALDTKEIKLVQLTQAELRRITLADGDLLFVRTNGNPDYVGRSAIYDDQRMIDAGYAPNASVYASYLIRARLNRSVCPAFIQAQLSSAEGRRHFRERSRTSAGQYNINTESLGTIPLMLPPLSLQLAFAEKAKAVTNMSPTTSLAKQTTDGVVSALAASVLG